MFRRTDGGALVSVHSYRSAFDGALITVSPLVSLYIPLWLYAFYSKSAKSMKTDGISSNVICYIDYI